jgi:hypothetical protein
MKVIGGDMSGSIPARSTSRPRRRPPNGSGSSACHSDEDLRDAILAEINNAPPHALYSAHANSGQRHVIHIFKRHLAEITKKQAEKIIEAWIKDGLLQYVEFKDERSRKRDGLALGE